MKLVARWLILALLWSPLVGLLIAPGASLGSVTLSARQWTLLGNTLLFTTATAAIGTAVALGVALSIWQWPLRRARAAALVTVAFIAVPGTITAAAWMVALSRVGLPTQGWGPTILVQVLTVLPAAVGIILLALRSLNADLLDAARWSQTPTAQLRRVVLPLIWPGVGAAFCVIATLTLSDFTVPSLFSTNVYALEIFSQFSTGTNPTGCAWPLLVCQLPLALIIARWAHHTVTSTGRTSSPVQLEGNWQPFASFSLAIFGLQCLVVACSLLGQVGSIGSLAVTAIHAKRELISSIQISGSSALFAVILALPFAGALSMRTWALLFMGAAWPASLVGIGTAGLLNGIGDVGTTTIAPVMGMTIRFVPLAIIAVAAFASRLNRAPLEAASVFMRPSRKLLKVWVPMIGPALMVAGCIVAALSLSELATTLILIPPGATTLAIRLYNMLHYGASDEVAGLSVLILISALLMSAVLLAKPRWQR